MRIPVRQLPVSKWGLAFLLTLLQFSILSYLIGCKQPADRPFSLLPAGVDSPLLLRLVFHPNKSEKKEIPNAPALEIPVTEDVSLGARLYLNDPSYTTLLSFHGNGEIADDYGGLAQKYSTLKANLLVIDYRGYGWSDGSPTIRSLTSDVPAILQHLPAVKKTFDLQGKMILFGRSMGSIPAIEAAIQREDLFAGLILESGISNSIPLLERFGYSRAPSDPPELDFSNANKLRQIQIPVLIIHGTQDRVVPYSNALENKEAVSENLLRFVTIENGGHNDLPLFGEDYWNPIRTFLKEVSEHQ